MKKGLKIGLIIGASILVLIGIAIAIFYPRYVEYKNELAYRDAELSGTLDSVAPDMGVAEESQVSSNAGEAESDADREIVRNGTIVVSVDDIDATIASVKSIQGEYVGEITYMEDTGKGKERVVIISLKVEESKFDDMYNRIKELDGEFTYSAISANDVTETVVDLEAQLKNLKSVETQYLRILQDADTVKDTLLVYEQLNIVRGQIESIEASLEYWSRQTDYSTVYMTITQSSAGALLSDEEWEPLGILKDAGRAVVSFVKFIGTGLIWIIVFSPIIAAVVVPVIIIQRKKRK